MGGSRLPRSSEETPASDSIREPKRKGSYRLSRSGPNDPITRKIVRASADRSATGSVVGVEDEHRYMLPRFISCIRWSQPRTASAMIVSVGF